MLRALEPLLLAHLTLQFYKSDFKWESYVPPKLKELRKKIIQHYQNQFSKTEKKKHLYVFLLLLKFKDDL
jgi:hypothetical protein